jgi:AIPR protein
MKTLRFHAPQFRALQSPNGNSRLGLFYTSTATLPEELWNWRDVNPREVNQRSSVYRAIMQTLAEAPNRFHERNRGITIVADALLYDDKRKEVVVELKNTKAHGVVDGAHTLKAILEWQQLHNDDDEPANVFIKVLVDVDSDQIAEIAGGLNTSQQVDLTSLENLREHFKELQNSLKKESYRDKIAYKMNEDKPVDVREILYYLAVFDCEEYTATKHPVALFGRKEGIVRRFAEQAGEKQKKAVDTEVRDSFQILISKAPDILRLRDKLEKAALGFDVGRYKVAKEKRIRSESNKENYLVFLDEKVNGKIPLGWVMPMLAGFRANVEWNRAKRTFSWIIPIDELLEASIEGLVLGIQEIHAQENSRPEYVGRNSIAWRMSYQTVAQAILTKQLEIARRDAR